MLPILLFVACQAGAPLDALPLAYRQADDGIPGVALAWREREERVPGRAARFAAPAVGGLAGQVLAVERLPLPIAPGAVRFVDGEPAGALGHGVSLELWRGTVEGVVDSDVFLALSPEGSRGWVRAFGETVHLVAERDESGRFTRARWARTAELGGAPPFTCDASPIGRGAGSVPPSGDPARGVSLGAIAALPLYRCRVALETDHAFYQRFGSVAGAETYALALLGAVGSTFRAEVGVVLEVSHLPIWTTPLDPWASPDFGGGTGDLLVEFQSAWNWNGPDGGDVNHFLSGAHLGGGIAWLDVLCLRDYGFAVSSGIAGNTPFPVVQGPLNWDFVVVAHELGHNFGSPHTHDYCPPLDQCAPSGYFGQCQTASICQPGTIMGYCHLCPEGIANVLPTFHPVVRARIREAVEAACIPPYADSSAESLGGGVASTVPGPSLAVQLDPIGRRLSFPYQDAPAPTGGVLVVGFSEFPLPFAGGVLLPSLDVVLSVSMPTPDGQFGPIPLGAGFPLGLELFVQAWMLDAATVFGVAATPAVRVELFVPVPPPALTWITHPTNGKQYALTPPRTWLAAEHLAAQHGAVLATISSPLLSTWLSNTFSAGSAGPFYIGFNDRYSEGQWRWHSGAPVSYVNWAPSEPNDWGGSEDYGMWPWGGNGWNDGSGLELRPALLERPIP